jgi:hypothetical protein
MADRTGRCSPVLDYVPAGYQVPNPVLEHTRGWATIHRPAAAVERTPAGAAVPPALGHDSDFGTGTDIGAVSGEAVAAAVAAVAVAAVAVDAVAVADDGDVFEAAL